MTCSGEIGRFLPLCLVEFGTVPEFESEKFSIGVEGDGSDGRWDFKVGARIFLKGQERKNRKKKKSGKVEVSS